MPAVYFQVRWPDGDIERCYSPSTVILEHFQAGQSYPLADFVERSQVALNIASERVHARFGFYCSASQDQRQSIENRAARYADQPSPTVVIEAFERQE